MKPNILLIEDDPSIRRFLRATLVTQGYELLEAATGGDGLAQAFSRVPDVILLDLGLPDMDGGDLLRQIREYSGVPIIILSARGQEREKIANLDAGADNISPNLSHGRVAGPYPGGSPAGFPGLNDGPTEPARQFGTITVDFDKRQVWQGQEENPLIPLEYKLLAELVKHQGKVVTHRQLLKNVWGPTFVDQNVYLRVFVLNLRRKLEDDPARPSFLITEPGVGYRLKIEG